MFVQACRVLRINKKVCVCVGRGGGGGGGGKRGRVL